MGTEGLGYYRDVPSGKKMKKGKKKVSEEPDRGGKRRRLEKGAAAGVSDAVAGEAAPPQAYVTEDNRSGPEPSSIKNKERRRKFYLQQKAQKKQDKREGRAKRTRDEKELKEQGLPVPERMPQKTIDNQRVFDETVVDPEDEEVALDQESDELASYFDGTPPKVIVTTSINPKGDTYKFAEEMINIFPNSECIPRKTASLKSIIKGAIERGYTDIVVINEDRKKPTGLVVCHLPNGPTAHFKLTSVKYNKDIKGRGRQTTHFPEVVLNQFHTRLGHQVGRLLNALFPQQPEFTGRSVVTFHNQRDFIFFRYHRYIFKNAKKVGLQELGPRFTLKLRSLQQGTFDTKYGEFEWVHKRKEMDISRRKFFL